MTLNDRIDSFAEMGQVLRDSLEGKAGRYGDPLEKLISGQQIYNPWFTPENVRIAVGAIACELTGENLINWTERYPGLLTETGPINAAVVMAGNIPAVGFHDFICVLISGHNLIAKTSSKDPDLLRFLGEMLVTINPGYADRIRFTNDRLKDFDLVIATGGDNSSRYFEYYFRKYPNLIRKNRNSIAVIAGDETEKELTDLGKDVFTYFGLGCRSVSKIFIPAGYDLTRLTGCWERYSGLADHSRYANNYDYNKAIFMVNREKFTDTGFLLLRESKELSSPVAVLHYEFYDSMDSVFERTRLDKDRIQCVVSNIDTPFGQSQTPRLWDYADGIDTIDFLLKKNIPGIL